MLDAVRVKYKYQIRDYAKMLEYHSYPNLKIFHFLLYLHSHICVLFSFRLRV